MSLRRREEEGISKTIPVGPRRREEEEEAKIVIPPEDGWFPKPLLYGKECRCPSCDYTVIIEEGARCLLTNCPRCGARMVDLIRE